MRGDDRNRTGVAAFAELCLTTRPRRRILAPAGSDPARPRLGAEDGGRTRDLNLGKVALYRLSYFRASSLYVRRNPSGNRGSLLTGAAGKNPPVGFLAPIIHGRGLERVKERRFDSPDLES